ncbi:MAG: RNA polymerase sigma factor, partial [Planctomycetota bacterium]
MSHASDTPNIDDLLDHASWVRALARTLVRDADLAEDLVQETWLAAVRRPPGHGENPKGWLGTIVRRLAARCTERSRGAADREAFVARSEELPSADELFERAAKQREVVSEVLELDPRYREVVLLRHFEELPPREIAALLGVPVETVHTRGELLEVPQQDDLAVARVELQHLADDFALLGR